ncbi:NAD(P)/FAD-dependent oxidoreductase [Halorutilales archaeon Cl-col2-1]
MSDTKEVGVVGGGVAGLVAARRLSKSGFDVTVYEKNAEVGGRVRSEKRDGFVFDRGFQVFFTAYPEARRQLNYDKLDLRYFDPGADVAHGGRVSTLSDPLRKPTDLLSTAMSRVATVGDKLRLMSLRGGVGRKSPREIFEGTDTSIREYLVSKGFSDCFIEAFAEPFYGGITLDASLSTSKKVFEFTFKMMSEGKVGVPSGGMGEIPAQIARRAESNDVEIRRGDWVEEIGDDATLTVDGETYEYDAVVVATDPKEARRLTRADNIPTEARSCVTQYYELELSETGMGKRILLNVDTSKPNHVVPLSNVAPEYTPDGREMASAVFLGLPNEDDDGLRRKTQSLLEKQYGVGDLEILHTDRIEFAQFAQPPGIHSRLPSNRLSEGHDVYLAGEFTEASSINAAMASGRKAAKAVTEDLG